MPRWAAEYGEPEPAEPLENYICPKCGGVCVWTFGQWYTCMGCQRVFEQQELEGTEE